MPIQEMLITPALGNVGVTSSPTLACSENAAPRHAECPPRHAVPKVAEPLDSASPNPVCDSVANAPSPDADDFASRSAESLRAARSYHRRALQFANSGWGASLVFNVGSIGLETYLVALCYRLGIEPENHNFSSLTGTLVPYDILTPSLESELESLDEIFGICSIDNYHHGEPTAVDASKVLRLLDALSDLFPA
jgi:hypothetical protein